MEKIGKDFFVVSSHGWSASNWLAHVLNTHPQIVCTHSALNELPNEGEIHESQGLIKNITRFHRGYELRVSHNLDQRYDAIEGHGEGPFYGSVHTIRLRDVPKQIETLGKFKRNYKAVNLVRHPLALVVSGFGQFRDLFEIDINELAWTSNKLVKTDLAFVYELVEKYDFLPGKTENLAFLCACRVLESLKMDVEAEKFFRENNEQGGYQFLGHVKMEDLTQDPSAMKELFETLALPTPEADYLDSIYAIGNLNQHDKKAPKSKLTQKWEDLLDWQKDCFIHFMEKYQLFDFYKNLGYTFDFMGR